MSYPPEPWDLAGSGRVTIWRVPTTALPQLPGGVRPWSVGGTSLAATAFVSYVDGPARPSEMEYDELLAAVAMRHGRRPALSAAARFGSKGLPSVRLPVPLRGSVVQTLAGGTVANPVRSGGRLRCARAQWHFAEDGPLSWLRGARPAASMLAEEFTLCFGSRLPGPAPSRA